MTDNDERGTYDSPERERGGAPGRRERPEEKMLNSGSGFYDAQPLFAGATERRGRRYNKQRDYTMKAAIDELKQMRNLFGTPANGYRHLHLEWAGIDYGMFFRFWSWRTIPPEIHDTIQRLWNIWKYKYLIIPREYYRFTITQEDVNRSYPFDYEDPDRREQGWTARFGFPELLG